MPQCASHPKRVWLFRNDTELNKINILQRNRLEKRPLRG
jgi:hypothetical protein